MEENSGDEANWHDLDLSIGKKIFRFPLHDIDFGPFFSGGKLDDITVIVGRVVRSHSVA